MKRRILLALILIVPAIIYFVKNENYSLRNLADASHTDLSSLSKYSMFYGIKEDSADVADKLKNLNPNWEYVKNTLFNPDLENRETYSPIKLEDDLILVLKNATQEDSLAFKSVFEELRNLLPHIKIAFFRDYKGISYEKFLIKNDLNYSNVNLISDKNIVFPVLKIRIADFENEKYIKETTQITSDNLTYTFNNHRDYMWFNTNFFDIYSNFNLTDKIPFEEKKQYIKFKLLRLLCLTYPLESKGGAEKEYPKENIFNANNKNPWNRKVTEMDKFLLQKLYALDFDKQFSDYMYKAYPNRYANYFLNPGLAKLKAIILVFLIGILAFVLSFNYFQNKKFKKSYLNYLMPSLAISIHIANLLIIYMYLTEMNITRYFEQWSAGISTALILALYVSFFLWGIEKLVIKKSFNFSYQLILKVLITFIVLNLPLIILFLNSIAKSRSADFLDEKVLTYIFVGFFALALARGLLIYLNQVSLSLVNEKEVELSKLKELHSQAEMKLLQSQINPHFLYNSLNSIASLAKIDADKTQQMAHSLSDLFKYSINRKGKENSTIKDEIEMVKTYLEIEKIRFGEHLQFKIDVDKALENKEIPLFLIQPLVENAIKHGISKNIEDGKITIRVEKQQGEITISVDDNGPNFPEGLLSGHGLQTVYDLLRLNYKDNASLNWTNHPKKKITITILDKK